jgi:hypothetical protein
MKGYNLFLRTLLYKPSPGSFVMPPSASIPHRILTNNMPSREEGRFA